MTNQNITAKARCSLFLYSDILFIEELEDLVNIKGLSDYSLNFVKNSTESKWSIEFLVFSNFESVMQDFLSFVELEIIPIKIKYNLKSYILISFLDSDSINNSININTKTLSFLYQNELELYINF